MNTNKLTSASLIAAYGLAPLFLWAACSVNTPALVWLFGVIGVFHAFNVLSEVLS